MKSVEPGTPEAPRQLVINVTANFTAEPIGEVLRFWIDRVALGPVQLRFSAYNQTLQELLSPDSALASRAPGVNLLLVRFEDWSRDQQEAQRLQTIAAAVREFVAALTHLARRAKRPTVLVLCPPSKATATDLRLTRTLQSLEVEVRAATAGLRGVSTITSDEMNALYPVDVIDDPEGDRQSHIPFTRAYWTALGTMLARKARSLLQPAHKVIVVDADNTLWGGVVAEVGSDEVQLKGEWLVLQEFLRDRKNQGMLLTLVSKNKEEDVAEVFLRPEMVLRREDFVCWKVNWEPKPRNVVDLAKELELGLDSFIFLDDNPVECADVAAHCPGVTTLLLPADTKRIPSFLRHVWAFDLQSATAVDQKRTELYRQQSERGQFRDATASFREFVEGLQLQVDFAPPVPAEYERAAQLTHRTNQFNTSGIRRTAAELSSLLASGERKALLVRVRDRFGDYGEVGLAIFSVVDNGLHVETLLLSCRVLGKGVEHRLLAALGSEARHLGVSNVVIPFKQTDRNEAAQRFLQSLGVCLGEEGSFRLPVEVAATVRFSPDSPVLQESSAERLDARPTVPVRLDFCAIATEFHSVKTILSAVSRYFRRTRPQLPNDYVAPQTLREAKLATIWADVLQIYPIGATDSFLSLGGQSLQAASIASRIATEFGVRIPLSVILSNPTITELDVHIGKTHHVPSSSSPPKAKEFSLSPAQQRLWFLDQFIPNRAAYNIPLGRRIQGQFNLTAMEQTLHRVVLRHDTLRSSYAAVKGQADLKISKTPAFSLQLLSAASEAEALVLANEEIRRIFDLSADPLLRCLVISMGASDHLLLLNVHHIVADGRSMGILLSELAEAYAATITGHEPSWRPLTASYFDYAEWQRERLTAGEFQVDLDYWKKELLGAPSLLEFPTDKPRPSVMTYLGDTVSAQVSSAARQTLETLASRESCTPFMVFLAAWQTILHRYSRQEDIVVGVPIAGRTDASLDELVGCFVNTLAVRTRVDGRSSFLSHLKEVRKKVLNALAHQDIPFEHLVSELGLERDPSHLPLFQVMLVFQDPPVNGFAPGMTVSPVQLHNGGAKADLVLEVTPLLEGYQLVLEFNTSLFLPETADRILHHFTRLLEQVCGSPETSLASAAMMDDDEVRQMLSFVSGAANFDDVECLHRWFERRVSTMPAAPALSCDGQALSYAEVNRRANQLAHYLIGCGVGPDLLVGICIERSLNLVIAILGVLKAGGAYLPIDLSYPTDRLAFMLADAQSSVLLTQMNLLPSLPKNQARIICLDDAETILGALPVTNPVTNVTPEHMAYVIYTSGSTGKPKGCMVTHRNVARLMRATEQWYGFNERDVWTLFHSSAFDFSVWEIWGALLYGGRLVIVPFLVSRSPEVFYELLAREQVTVLNQTPSAFRQLMQAEDAVGPKTLTLRYVIFGGEALEMQSLRPWFDRHGDQKPRLVNMYGITETTVHVTYRPLSRNDLDSGSVIGVPIPDLQVYILDAQQQPVPIGVPGELYVGGGGLARGYLRRPELTEERFIPDHITGHPGSRLYRTGDLARFLPTRDIEYLGRIDDQVKIRGFRIELGEIESVLCQHPKVRQASVMAREDVPGEKRLVAYLVTNPPAPEVSSLREHLKRKLPEYMVPTAFVFLEKLLLTNNGKIDRKALPVPEQLRPELARCYTAPRTPTEQKLATIWSKVLRVNQVGINDNFFELGGDSILSIQVISLARREGLKLTPKLLFANQTIAELAAVVGMPDEMEPTREAGAADIPLTPIQQWFFEHSLDDMHHYNQAFLFEVVEPMDRSLLESALQAVGRQHDALRLRYVHEPKGWRQFHSTSEEPASLTWVDLTKFGEAEQRSKMEAVVASTEASLNLEHGPLWRIAYLDFGPDLPGRLLFVVHHLAVDGVSWQPLMEDLETAYHDLKSGQAIQLPPKTTSYGVWADRLRSFAAADSLQKELPYWKAVTDPVSLIGAVTPLPIPGVDNTEASASTLGRSLSIKETQELLQRVPVAYHTQINDVLLTALARAWIRWTGSGVLFTNLEGHGRESLFEDVDLSRTAGWFTSIFPVRLELRETGDSWQPGEALKSVKEQLRQIPQHGIGYGMLRYLRGNSALSSRPEPSILFNYLGQFDQVLSGSKLFRFAKESTGLWHSPKQRRRYALEMNSLVIDGCLELRWTYSQNVHSETAIHKFADEFVAALRDLIIHCQSPHAGGYTPTDFPLAHLEQSTLDRLVAGQRDVEDIYPLSPIQTLFFSTNPGAGQSSFDHWHCTLRGDLDVSAFQLAWRETVCRHTILRSTIHSDGLRDPMQMVHRNVHLPWIVEDLRSLPSDQHLERLTAFLKKDRAQPLTLTEAPVMRFALIRLANEIWKFLWSVPALLLDGWSWPVVFRDASRLYEAFRTNLPLQLEPVRPYRDYIEWLNRQSSDDATRFWRKTLAGFLEPTPLPDEILDAEVNGERYAEHVLDVPATTSNALQLAARQLQLTVSTLVQGAWALQLSHQSANTDVLFGAAFAGRPADLPGVESIVGPFVNNVPVRVSVDNGTNTGDFLRQLHAQLLELSQFQFTPLSDIQFSSGVSWRNRLFDSVVVFQNYLVDESARRFGVRIEVADFSGPIHSNYPLMLLVEPGEAIRLTLKYDRHRMSQSTVQRWGQDLATLLALLPTFFDRRIADLKALLSLPPAKVMRTAKRLRVQSQNCVLPQTESERTIAGIWQTMFGFDQISIDDNFFDLGGHSLLLIQMHGRLREKLKSDFPIVSLLEHPTIRSLALSFDQHATSKPNRGEQLLDRAQRQRDALAQMRLRVKR